MVRKFVVCLLTFLLVQFDSTWALPSGAISSEIDTNLAPPPSPRASNRTQRFFQTAFFPLGFTNLQSKFFRPTITTPSPVQSGNLANQAALAFQNSVRLSHGAQPLRYSATLQTIAQQCANYIAPGVQLPCPGTTVNGVKIATEIGSVGQNIRMDAESRNVRQALITWYGERDNFDWTMYVPTSSFTKIIWNSFTDVACARSTISGMPEGSVSVVCVYSPPIVEPVNGATFMANIQQDTL